MLFQIFFRYEYFIHESLETLMASRNISRISKSSWFLLATSGIAQCLSAARVRMIFRNRNANQKLTNSLSSSIVGMMIDSIHYCFSSIVFAGLRIMARFLICQWRCCLLRRQLPCVVWACVPPGSGYELQTPCGAISHRTLGYPTVALTAEVFLIEIRFLCTIRAQLYGKLTMYVLTRALLDEIAHQSL